MKHTPGPWTVKGNYILACCSENVAKIPHTPFDTEQDKANARLIAAAPELLSACLIALPFVRQFYNAIDPGLRDEYKPIADALIQAIAKAEGR